MLACQFLAQRPHHNYPRPPCWVSDFQKCRQGDGIFCMEIGSRESTQIIKLEKTRHFQK